jgi:hypothetical protein
MIQNKEQGDVMTLFDSFEQAQETKYSRELSHNFKVNVRRNQLIGLWLAEKIGLNPSQAHDYAQTIIESDFKEPGHEDVVQKLLMEIKKNNLQISEDQIRRKMEYYLERAEEEFKNI